MITGVNMNKMLQGDTFIIPKSAQVRAARALLGVTQADCAKMAGIALSLLKKYEALANNEEPLRQMRFDTIEKLVGFYENCGVQFTFTNENISVKIQVDYLT